MSKPASPYEYYIALRTAAEDDPTKRNELSALADLVLRWIGQHADAPATPLPDDLQARINEVL